MLERQIVTNLGPLASKAGGSAGIISSTVKLPPPVANDVAAAFAHTFWWSVFTILIAFVPTLFLPNHAAVAGVPSLAGNDANGNAETGGGDADGGTPVAGAMLD